MKRKWEAFKRWITHNVLPSIRKTGKYDKVAERIGRTKGRYPTVNRYYPIFKSSNQQPINRKIFLNLLNFLSN